jgi:MFS family permease
VIAMVVTMATFMEVLDTSIANVALPHIAGTLSASTDESAWVLSSYLVANAVILPISAWLATRFGRKRFYMTCVVLFGISSLACGFATSLSRRTGAQRTGDSGRHVSTAKARHGVCDLRNGGGARAGHRSYARRIYHG